jgi:hypothetical protein
MQSKPTGVVESMTVHKPTIEEERLIRDINEFRDAVSQWSGSHQEEERERLRSLINRRLEGIQEIVILAGCHQTITIAPPAMIGGLVMQNADPFDYILLNVYGSSLQSYLFDMLDRTIGIIESGKFAERKSHLEKIRGPLGPISGRKIFLVHGHDDSARETTARLSKI